MNILNKVNSSNDIKRLNKNELPQLCAELREFIIENVSKTGGHLASNLGTDPSARGRSQPEHG